MTSTSPSDPLTRSSELLAAHDHSARLRLANEHLAPINLPSLPELAARRAALEKDWPNRQPSARDRLSIEPMSRCIVAFTSAFFIGASFGAISAGKMAALRYRAENAHRLPTNPVGWFFYHKSKNYNVMWAAIKEAGKKGPMLGGWAVLYMGLEEAVDTARGTRDFASSVVAGMTVAGVFGWRRGFKWHTAARMTKMGMMLGGAFGLSQDALALVQGREVLWVSYLKGLGMMLTGGEGEVVGH